MAFGIKLHIWGDYACFTRPEMKVERTSYDIITPSAARGVLEAIYWKPQMRWVVDRIHVQNPVRMTHVRRNEIASTIPIKGKNGVLQAMKEGKGHLGLEVDRDRQQRAAMILRDVSYGLEAHVELVAGGADDSGAVAKHLEMFKRRAARGQYFQHPYFGNREFPVNFELVDVFPVSAYAALEEHSFGMMLNDIRFPLDRKGPIVRSNDGERVRALPQFFEAVMRKGVVDVPRIEQAGDES